MAMPTIRKGSSDGSALSGSEIRRPVLRPFVTVRLFVLAPALWSAARPVTLQMAQGIFHVLAHSSQGRGLVLEPGALRTAFRPWQSAHTSTFGGLTFSTLLAGKRRPGARVIESGPEALAVMEITERPQLRGYGDAHYAACQMEPNFLC
jgi:hypothetical protein